MLPQSIRRTFLSVMLCLLFAAGVRAEDITDHLPDDALGFVVMHNAEAANDKISKFMQLFDIPMPPPLTFLKFATGLGEGIDQKSDIVIALLPGDAGSRNYRPLVLLPVDDYAALAASVHGDASGEACRVTISGEDVLMAKDGPFAILMNVEHRTTMERLLSLAPKPIEALRPYEGWLETNDVAVVLLAPGVEALLDMGRQGLDEAEQQFSQNMEDAEMEQMVERIEQSFGLYREMMKVTDAAIETVALGLAVDEQTNVRLGLRAVLDKNSGFAKLAFAKSEHAAPLAGLAAAPIVFAGGGALPEGWGDWVAKTGRRIVEQFPKLSGFEDLDKKDLEKMEELYRASSEGVRSMSFVMQLVDEDQPLLSGMYGLIGVEDSSAYLESYKKSIELNNELMQRSSSDIQLEYEISPTTVGDFRGYGISVDIAEAAGDQNNPIFQMMLGDMLGEDGKLKMNMLVIDETNVVFSTAEEDHLLQFISDVQQGATGLQDSPQNQITLRLLDKGAPCVTVVSPKGYVEIIARFMNSMMGQFGGGAPTIPDYPDAPPVGFTLNLVDGRWEGDMVLPVEMLKGLAQFIKTAQQQ